MSQATLPDHSSTKMSSPSHPRVAPFSASFFDSNMKVARGIYLKILIGGCFALIVVMFTVFSIFWGALWKTPAHKLKGWVVDFDQSSVGNAMVQALLESSSSASSHIEWTSVPSSNFLGGPSEVANDVVEQRTWIAVVVHGNATSNLQAAVSSADASYNGTSAITVYGNQARSENGYNALLAPTVQSALLAATARFAQTFAKQLASSSSSNLTNLLSNAPQVVTQPISFTIDNLRPFNIPVATALTYVGLIYTLILTFFIVNIGVAARQMSGLESILQQPLSSDFV
ncbi:hypothetical protein D9757_005893 [Collybiopsis confluens]|uniref:DUF3533 domain-containing protein n=1 Tax=Collybiopsis confluens TaxID=2823264 RepID=A0A8H5HN91_9AGAR|nr:hypothetical protein D9757_005893 [Collybiopsis confluens]